MRKYRYTGIVLICLLVSGWASAAPPYFSAHRTSLSLAGTHGPGSAPEYEAESTGQSNLSLIPRPKYVRGLFLTGNGAASPELSESVIALLRESGLNSLVVNVKDDVGCITYKDTRVQLAIEAGANKNQVDMRVFLDRLRKERIYPIARIVVAKDKFVSTIKPEWFFQDKDGGVWTGKGSVPWADLRTEEYWEYLVEIAIEAAEMGFREIQFDYVRWPSGGDGVLSRIATPIPSANMTKSGPYERSEATAAFLTYARRQLAPFGVDVSADTFGIMGTVLNEQTVGQQFEVILSSELHAISPMIYPSHYWHATYGQANPNRAPYEVAYQSALDHLVRMEALGSKTILRPWLQDFEHWEDKSFIYGVKEIQAQLRAMQNLGIMEFLFWNASNIYTEEAYRTWAMGRYDQHTAWLREKYVIN